GSDTRCFWVQPWPGPATPSRCVAHGSMVCTLRPSPPSGRWSCTCPLYLLAAGTALIKAPWGDLALQAFVQGLLTAIVSLVLYGRAVSMLGASSGAAFAALSPAMTAVMAIPILGEWPRPMDWIAIAAISLGVYIVSGGPGPRPRW